MIPELPSPPVDGLTPDCPPPPPPPEPWFAGELGAFTFGPGPDPLAPPPDPPSPPDLSVT